ncbi:MAG: transcriptional regulator [marine bacterium B5-7]|nr:MAG: transcriptional regulator [marine bacterium B5-7]
MSSTIAETIRERISKDIVTGVIAPGMKLEEKALADQYNVSRTPVRDALRQLESTGLVEFRPRRGATVANIGVEKLLEMYEVQSELEGLCARLSARRMTAMERHQLESLHEQARQAIENSDTDRYSTLNEELHNLIYRGTHNDSITDLTVSFRRRLAPFRTSIFFKAKGRVQESFNEHCKIIDAILASDADRAYIETRNHVISSSVNVVEYLKSQIQEREATA